MVNDFKETLAQKSVKFNDLMKSHEELKKNFDDLVLKK